MLNIFWKPRPWRIKLWPLPFLILHNICAAIYQMRIFRKKYIKMDFSAHKHNTPLFSRIRNMGLRWVNRYQSCLNLKIISCILGFSCYRMTDLKPGVTKSLSLLGSLVREEIRERMYCKTDQAAKGRACPDNFYWTGDKKCTAAAMNLF